MLHDKIPLAVCSSRSPAIGQTVRKQEQTVKNNVFIIAGEMGLYNPPSSQTG